VDKKLLIQAIGKYLLGVLLLPMLLFIPAGTLKYWNAWLLIGILFIPMFFAGIVLLIKNPELLRKRLNMKEKETEQKSVILFGGLMFICGFVVAGLDFRNSWLILPEWVAVAAAVVFLLAYLLYAEVLRENTYLSRTIEIQENQKVIDTGMYGIVRHPMYLSTLLLFLSMPLVLGSLLSFILFLIYPVIMVKRIKNEEQVLEKGLEGYSEYKKCVKYRVIPFIW
jgi:protein-S-isoprenylcysteine O-methyltransferase Ste14